VTASYHRIMTSWISAKRDGYMNPSSRRQLVLGTQDGCLLGH
jgi:hypothetical protein